MNKYMSLANDLAKQNIKTNDGGPFGAVIVKDDKIVGIGNNQVIKNNDPTAHAEVIAIRDACNNLKTYDLKDCEIYTSCYPCPMCLSAIMWANIKVVYYGNTRKDANGIGFRDDVMYEFLDNMEDETVLKLIQIDRENTIKTFIEFNSKEEKEMY
ncbi:MAG: nucleoside deaminase [Firmicutes bacterium]|nr:nucleoside deaminase [Bacillota bacterium]